MIDEAVLARQRIGRAARVEYTCPGCGKRTTDKEGSCSACRRVGGAVQWERLTTKQITNYIALAKAELVRRRDELSKLLEEA